MQTIWHIRAEDNAQEKYTRLNGMNEGEVLVKREEVNGAGKKRYTVSLHDEEKYLSDDEDSWYDSLLISQTSGRTILRTCKSEAAADRAAAETLELLGAWHTMPKSKG